MKVTEFSGNTRDCNFEYHQVREGPNRFVTYYKNSSRLFYDISEGWKDAWRVMGTAKFTTSEAMEEESPSADTKMIT